MNVGNTGRRAELEERLRFETLIADLSSKFVGLAAGEVDRGIIDAERAICDALDLDLGGSVRARQAAEPPHQNPRHEERASGH